MGASGGRDRSAFPAVGGRQGARRPDRIRRSPHVILSRADGCGPRRAAHGAESGTEPEKPARPGCSARAEAHWPSSCWAVGPAARGRAWYASLEAHSTTSSRPVGGLVHSFHRLSKESQELASVLPHPGPGHDQRLHVASRFSRPGMPIKARPNCARS